MGKKRKQEQLILPRQGEVAPQATEGEEARLPERFWHPPPPSGFA